MSTATQDSAATLHPLLATLVARLEEAGVDGALASGAAQVRRWQKRGRTDSDEKLTTTEAHLVEEAVMSLNGQAHGGQLIDDETAAKVVGRAEHLAVVMEGLPRNTRAEEVARKLLETDTTGDQLYSLLDTGVKMHRHLARVLKRKSKRVPILLTDERMMAEQQVDGSGHVIVEASPGTALAARGSRGTKPAALPAEKGAATGGFEQIHPRGRGGKWIAKGAGQGAGGPDQAVKQLQQRLHELGFQTTQDGQFGTVTEQAVIAFQKKYGLPPTGKVDQATIETMRQPPSIDAKTARAQLAPKLGLQSRAAQQRLEAALTSIGYDSGGADTATALRRLQRQYGLDATGKPDNATLDLIKRLQERDKRQASKKGGGQLSADQLQHSATTEEPEEGDMSDEHQIDEASYSSGGFDTNTPVRQPSGGVLPALVAGLPTVGGLPAWRGVNLVTDPEDRTPGMDNFLGTDPVMIPPNLRETEEGTFQRCGTCVHHNGKKLCGLYSAGTDRDDLCDSWLTLSPQQQILAAQFYAGHSMEFAQEASAVNAEKLRHARARLEEAVEQTGGDELASMTKKFTDKGMPAAAAKKAAVKALARKRVQEHAGLEAMTVNDAVALVEPVLAESEWVALDEAADSMAKATKHEEVGHTGKGLWGHKGLQLPAYIQHIANDIREKRGKTTSQAIAIAIGAVKRWARGGGGVDAGTRAAAAKAVAEWEKLKATHGGKLKEAFFEDTQPEPTWLSYAATIPSFISRVAKYAHYEEGMLVAEALQYGVAVARKLGAAGDREAAAAAQEWNERRERVGGHALVEATLTAEQRKKLPHESFAIPEKKAYPIHDESHARAALTMVAQHGTPEEKKRVRAAVKRKHPGVQVAEAFDARDLAVAVAESGWSILDRPPVEVTAEEARSALADVKLHEASFPASIHFDPRLHPRARTGEFTDVLSKLMKASHGSEATLPHGVSVKRSRGGARLTVSQGGKKLGSFSSPEKASARALAATGIPSNKPSYGKQTDRFSIAFDKGDKTKDDNRTIIARAVNGDLSSVRGKNVSAVSHHPNTTTIYTYKEPLAHIDHGERRVYLNVHRYSPTSSAHRTLVSSAAKEKGYSIHEIDRAEAHARVGSEPRPFTKLPAGVKSGGATGPKPGTPGWAAHRQEQAATADRRAAELHAQGNHEHAKDYEAMAARFRQPSGGEKSGGGTGGEKGRIVPGSMGSFLTPPGHPDQRFSVETDLRRRQENRGQMALSSAATDPSLDAATRAAAARKLREWKPAPLDHPAVQEWIHSTVGYFQSMYRNPDAPAGQEWHTSHMLIDRQRDPMKHADDHAGVNFVRRYYPEYKPKAEHFAPGGYGQKSETLWHHDVESLAGLHDKLRNSDLVRMTDKPDVTIHRITGEGVWRNATHVVRQGDRQKIAYSAEQAAGWARGENDGLDFAKGASMNWKTGQHFFNGSPTTNRPGDTFAYTGASGDKSGDGGESWPEFHNRVFDNPNAAFRDLKPGDKFSFPHSTDVHTKASGAWYVAPDGRRYKTGAGVLLTKHDGEKSGGTTARFSRPGSHNYPNLPNGAELVSQIKAGTRVTIMSPQGQERSGKAVMRSSDGGWVLNMGGAHGTPGLVNERNIVRLGGARKSDSGTKSGGAATLERPTEMPGRDMVTIDHYQRVRAEGKTHQKALEHVSRVYGGGTPEEINATLARNGWTPESEGTARPTLTQRPWLNTRSGGFEYPKGRTTLQLHSIPHDWLVQHGYAEVKHHPERTQDYGNANSGRGSVTQAYDQLEVKPGLDVEKVWLHYLSGRAGYRNAPQGSTKAQQFNYTGKGGKKADRVALLRKLTEAEQAFAAGDFDGYDKLLTEALALRADRVPAYAPLSEIAEDVVEAVPALKADHDMVAVLRAEEAVLVRLPLASLLVRHGPKMPREQREALQEALREIAPKDDMEGKLREARERKDSSAVKLYETLVSAVS